MSTNNYTSPLSERYRFAHDNQVCVIANIAAGCAKVNDSLCIRALLTISVFLEWRTVIDEPSITIMRI